MIKYKFNIQLNLQVLKKYPQFAVIPDKLTVSKRISQCCNPALPSGVHTKTLETCEIIFDRLSVCFF